MTPPGTAPATSRMVAGSTFEPRNLTALCRQVMAFRRSPPDTFPSVSIAFGAKLTPSAAQQETCQTRALLAAQVLTIATL